MLALASLTCGWAVACHNDEENALPPKAATVPNASSEPLPLPITKRPDSSSEPDPQRTTLTIAVERDPTLSADAWLLRASVPSEDGSDRSVVFEDHAELLLKASSDLSAEVRIEVYGKTMLSDGTEYVLGHRVATTHFVPNESRLAYLFVDQQCAYSGGGVMPTNDGGSGCASTGQWCYEGKCRAEEIPTADLFPVRSDWHENPPSPCPSQAPSLLLGEGLVDFAEKKDGDTVTIECGPQGGHHIWIAVRTTGLDQRNPIVMMTSPATDAGAPLATSYPIARLYAAEGTAQCEAKGIQFQLDPDGRSVLPYLGEPLDVTVAVQDRNGEKAQVTRHLNVAAKLSTTSCASP